MGSKLIRVGNSVSALVATFGEPLYKEPVESGYGGYVADRWQYRLDGKAVNFVIGNGRIESIEEIRDGE